MELDKFIKRITDILDDNSISYFFKDIGHIRENKDNYLFYTSKDLMIFFNDNNCLLNLMFTRIEHIYYLKEMTIEISNEKEGYRHCIIFDKSENTHKVLPLETILEEDSLNCVLDYIIDCIIHKNDKKYLNNLWKSSISRNEYKEKYPEFYNDIIGNISEEQYNRLISTFVIIQKVTEKIFIFNEDNLNININYE